MPRQWYRLCVMSKDPYQESALRRVSSAVVATSILIASSPAAAFDLFCMQRSALSFWLGEAGPIDAQSEDGEIGRVHFFFDTATGEYIERRVGSRAAITDRGRFDIVHDESAHGRDILAVLGNTTLHIRVGVEQTAFLRVDRGAVIEIGSCEPVTE